jgi:hypothetical protein
VANNSAAPGTCAQKASTHVRKTQPSPIPVYLSLCVSSVSLSRSQSLSYLSQSLLSLSVAPSLFRISLSLFCLSQSLSVSFVSLSVSSVSLSRSQSLSVSFVSLSVSSVSLSRSQFLLYLSRSLLLSLYLFIYYSVETWKQLGKRAIGWDSDALEGKAVSSSKELESQLDASPSSARRHLLSTKKLHGLTR